MTDYTVVLSIFTCWQLSIFLLQIRWNFFFPFSLPTYTHTHTHTHTHKIKHLIAFVILTISMLVVQMTWMANVSHNAFQIIWKESVKPDVFHSSKSWGESAACGQTLWLECYLTAQSVTPPCHAVVPSPVLMLNAQSFLSMDRLNTSVIGCPRLKHCCNVLYNISINTCPRHWGDKMGNDCC